MATELHALPDADRRPLLSHFDDARIVELMRDGDGAAFEELCRRHRPLMLRLAKRMLKDPHLAEDVVQEALWRAHRGLLRDRAPMALKAWLCQITRNCSLDEIARRQSHGSLSLSDEHPALDNDPADVMSRKASAHELLHDLVDLPYAQRHALVRRELDGIAHEQIAAELDITPGASRNLVHRARINLAKVTQSRDVACVAVQQELQDAHDRRGRASASVYRHLAGCGECRSYRRRLAVCRQVMASVMVPPGALLVLAVGAKGLLAGVLPASGVTAKPIAITAATALLAGGAVTIGTQIAGPGQPSPLALRSQALPGGQSIQKGQTVPAGTAVLTRHLPSGQRVPHHVVLRCPTGMVVAGLVPNPDTRITRVFDPATHLGKSGTARVNLRANGPLSEKATVATLCRSARSTPSWRP